MQNFVPCPAAPGSAARARPRAAAGTRSAHRTPAAYTRATGARGILWPCWKNAPVRHSRATARRAQRAAFPGRPGRPVQAGAARPRPLPSCGNIFRSLPPGPRPCTSWAAPCTCWRPAYSRPAHRCAWCAQACLWAGRRRAGSSPRTRCSWPMARCVKTGRSWRWTARCAPRGCGARPFRRTRRTPAGRPSPPGGCRWALAR